MTFLINVITPTPIPIDDLPPEFGSYLFGVFKHIVQGLKNCIIPFTHASLWDYVMWCIVVAAIIKSVKLIYGKGESHRDVK